MSRTLANMSRALSSYGSQAAGIHRDAGRNASMLRMRAADIRADATRQRGQNFAGLATGLGKMVSQEMLQAPIRERENQMQDLNMRMGEQRLEMGEQEMAARAKALEEKQKVKARREQYIGILSDHYGDPTGTMKALKDAGMVEEMNAEYQKIMMLREQKAKTNTAEWKEAETQARLVSETIGGLLRLEGPARDEGYPIARSRILSLMPYLESFLPETPDAQTYELLGDNATMLRTAADQMGMDESEIKKVEAARKRQEGMEKKAGDIFDKAIAKLSKTSKGFWDNEVAFQRKKIEKNSPDQLGYFDQITSGGHNRETKSALKAWAGEEKGFTGEYGNYVESMEVQGKQPQDFLGFVAQKENITSPPLSGEEPAAGDTGAKPAPKKGGTGPSLPSAGERNAYRSLKAARSGLTSLYTMVEEGLSPANLRDRAKYKQVMNDLVLTFATLKQRGANFTETEQVMIRETIGGDPNSFYNRYVVGDNTYKEKLQHLGKRIEEEAQALAGESYETYEYPWMANTGMTDLSDEDLLNQLGAQ